MYVCMCVWFNKNMKHLFNIKNRFKLSNAKKRCLSMNQMAMYAKNFLLIN